MGACRWGYAGTRGDRWVARGGTARQQLLGAHGHSHSCRHCMPRNGPLLLPVCCVPLPTMQDLCNCPAEGCAGRSEAAFCFADRLRLPLTLFFNRTRCVCSSALTVGSGTCIHNTQHNLATNSVVPAVVVVDPAPRLAKHHTQTHMLPCALT